MDTQMHKRQQGQMSQLLMTHQPHPLPAMNMMNGFGNGQPVGFSEAKGLMLGNMSQKGVSVGQSYSNNTTNEEGELSFGKDANSEESNGKVSNKEAPWKRMKWTDAVVRLLIIAVAAIGVDCVDETDGPKRKFGVCHKKGKWKNVSDMMLSKGCSVSPQQCEDKFNDLNKRYKKLNDILGRGTSCQVVENPSLMDSMPHLTSKDKDEVRKILNSRHLFYREMCAYHNGQEIPDSSKTSQLPTSAVYLNGNGASEEQTERSSDFEDDDSYDNDEKTVEANPVRSETCYARNCLDGENPNFQPFPSRQDGVRVEMSAMFQDLTRSPADEIEWTRQQIWQLQEQKVQLEAEALDLEKQQFKWSRFRRKKDIDLERLRLSNERLKLENERMVLHLKQNELALGDPEPETSPKRICLNNRGVN